MKKLKLTVGKVTSPITLAEVPDEYRSAIIEKCIEANGNRKLIGILLHGDRMNVQLLEPKDKEQHDLRNCGLNFVDPIALITSPWPQPSIKKRFPINDLIAMSMIIIGMTVLFIQNLPLTHP